METTFDSHLSDSDNESTFSYKFTDMKHFREDELCVIDDLSDLQLKMMVYEKIMKMKDVHRHKFHKKRRNSVEVTSDGLVVDKK
jgi:hypothetical protein